jgi:hypothetical protein
MYQALKNVSFFIRSPPIPRNTRVGRADIELGAIEYKPTNENVRKLLESVRT